MNPLWYIRRFINYITNKQLSSDQLIQIKRYNMESNHRLCVALLKNQDKLNVEDQQYNLKLVEELDKIDLRLQSEIIQLIHTLSPSLYYPKS